MQLNAGFEELFMAFQSIPKDKGSVESTETDGFGALVKSSMKSTIIIEEEALSISLEKYMSLFIEDNAPFNLAGYLLLKSITSLSLTA